MTLTTAYFSVVLIWATTPLAIQWSTAGTAPMFGLSTRMLLSTVLCIVILVLLRRRFQMSRQATLSYIAGGLGLYFTMVCVYFSSLYIDTGLISVVFGLTPVVTSVLAARWLQENALTIPRILGLFCGLAGLTIVFGENLYDNVSAGLGVGLVFIATVAHGASAVTIKKLNANVDALSQTTGTLLFALPLFALTWLVTEGNAPQTLPIRAIGAIVYLSVFGSVIGFLLYYYTLRRASATTVALVTLITPVLAVVIGHWLNNEPITTSLILGASLILSGLSLHQWGDRFFPGFPR